MDKKKKYSVTASSFMDGAWDVLYKGEHCPLSLHLKYD